MTDDWKVDVPEGTSGQMSVVRFDVSEDESRMSFLTGRGRGTPAGSYTKLVRQGSWGVVMSDTPDERRDHLEIMWAAKGRVLLNGLGLGCVLQCCARSEKVEKVTVVEKNEDVIKLVWPHYCERFGDKIEVVHADAFEYKPPRGVRYGAVWHDIWDDMCEDNLPQMHKLHRKYGRRTDWQGSWGREFIERRRRSSW